MFYDLLRSIILPLKEIDESLPQKGKIIDLGCGEGVIARYLAKGQRQIIGVDLNEKRLPSLSSKNLKFEYADIRTFNLKGATAVVISDVLHHLNFQDQKKLLLRISKNLNKKGILIIKEIDNQEFIRSKLSRMWDFLLYPKDKICYWDSSQLKKLLGEYKFNVKVIRVSRFFPGSTTLFICKKC